MTKQWGEKFFSFFSFFFFVHFGTELQIQPGFAVHIAGDILMRYVCCHCAEGDPGVDSHPSQSLSGC